MPGAVLLAILIVGCGAAESDDIGEQDDEEHGEEHPSEVTLSEAALARAGITTAPAAVATIGGGTGVPAELQPDPGSTAHVAALMAGRVMRVDVGIGDRVAAGQELGVVASGGAGESRAALAAARVRRDAARVARDRQAALVESGIGARRGLIEAEAALAEAEAEIRGLSGSLGVVGRGAGADVRITAPIAGVVVERHAVAGEVVEAGALLFTITDPTHLWVVGFVPELDLSVAREGAPCTLSVAAFPGERWSGHIDFVAPALDEATRTLGVRAILDTPDSRLRAGLFGRLAIARAGAEPTAVVVPASALARVGGENVVFVPASEERAFRPVPVLLGRHEGDVIEVREGLSAGDVIVTRGAFTLRSELSRGELAEDED